MSLKFPHQQPDVRLNCTVSNSQQDKNEYKRFIMRMLSYALTNSLNNYHALLKQRGMLLPKQSNPLSNKIQSMRTQNCISQQKQNRNVESTGTAIIQTKKPNKRKTQQEQLPHLRLISPMTHFSLEKHNLNSDQPLQKDIIISKKGKKGQKDVLPSPDLVDQAKLMKFEMVTSEKARILQNLLLRQVERWPTKCRHSGTSREVRSLLI